MTRELTNIIGIFIVSAFFLSLLADIIFTYTWNKTYFTSGLMIFIKRIPATPYTNVPFRQSRMNIPDKSLFEKRFRSDSDWLSSLTFMEIDACSYGFHGKLFELKMRQSSIMHGVVIFDADNNQVVVKGFADWSVLVFGLVWSTVSIFFLIHTLFVSSEIVLFDVLFPLGAIFIFTLIVVFSYLLQSSRFSKIALFAVQVWSRNV